MDAGLEEEVEVEVEDGEEDEIVSKLARAERGFMRRTNSSFGRSL